MHVRRRRSGVGLLDLPTSTAVQVPLKDAWARTEPHGRELRCMGAHGATWPRMHAGTWKSTQHMDTNCNASYAWARTPAKGHAVAGAGYKAEMPLWLCSRFLDDTTDCMVLLTVRMHGRNKRENVIYRVHAHGPSYRDCYLLCARTVPYRDCYVPCTYMYRAHTRTVIIVPETYLLCARPQSN